MIPRSVRIALALVLSLVAVALWAARSSQGTEPAGVEVRFLESNGQPGKPHGTLVANINGQWLPVTLDTMPMPDGNSVIPSR